MRTRADALGQLTGRKHQLWIGGVGATITVVVSAVADFIAAWHAGLLALAADTLLSGGAIPLCFAARDAYLVYAQIAERAVILGDAGDAGACLGVAGRRRGRAVGVRGTDESANALQANLQ